VQIRDDVLHSTRYPQATFTSTSVARRADGGYDVAGVLMFHGQSRSIRAETKLIDDRQALELSLHQPDYGITPFKAMLGTLKIRADVIVRFSEL
jgi:polyisoprenoid-binding protein YceI